MFGGFGPIVTAIVIFIVSKFTEGVSLSGTEILIATVSTYILAFIQAGASVFNSIEEWPIMKSLLCHFSVLYIAYVLCYVINAWIPFDIKVVAVFTAVFIAGYFAVWTVVYLSVKSVSRKLTKKIG